MWCDTGVRKGIGCQNTIKEGKTSKWQLSSKRVLSRHKMGFPAGSDRKESASNAGDPGSIPGLGRSQEKGMATYSSITAWRIPWTEEAGGLQSMGCKEWDTTEQLTLCTKKLFSRFSDTSALFCIHTPHALLFIFHYTESFLPNFKTELYITTIDHRHYLPWIDMN